MKEKLPASHWLFAIEEAPVFVAVTRNGVTKNVPAPHRKALIAADSGHIVGIVGDSYRVFTNQQAVDLCQQFCRDAFPDTTPSEWIYELRHGPSTRSWAAMDIRHRSHTMNLLGVEGGPSDIYTPFARIPCTGVGEITATLKAKAFCTLVTSRFREKAPAGPMKLTFRPALKEVAVEGAGVKAWF